MIRDTLRNAFPGIIIMLRGIKNAIVAIRAYLEWVEVAETLRVSEQEKEKEKEMMEAKLYITVEEV